MSDDVQPSNTEGVADADKPFVREIAEKYIHTGVLAGDETGCHIVWCEKCGVDDPDDMECSYGGWHSAENLRVITAWDIAELIKALAAAKETERTLREANQELLQRAH